MLHRRASYAHAVRLFIEACLSTIQNVRMRPPTDTTFFAGGALGFDRATRTGRCPVALNLLTLLGACRAVRQPFPSWTLVLVVPFGVLERRPIEQALGLVG